MTDHRVWTGMSEISDRLLFDKVRPNKSLVEEVLSLDAAKLDIISDDKLRQYLVVLGQYLITLQYEENKTVAVCKAWEKTLDNHIYSIMHSPETFPESKSKASLAEKKA